MFLSVLEHARLSLLRSDHEQNSNYNLYFDINSKYATQIIKHEENKTITIIVLSSQL